SDERRSYKLRERVRRWSVAHIEYVTFTSQNQFTSSIQRRTFILISGQILHLHQTRSFPTRSVCAVELKQPPHPTILPCAVNHYAVFLHRGFTHFLPDLKHSFYVFIEDFFDQSWKYVLIQAIHFNTRIR